MHRVQIVRRSARDRKIRNSCISPRFFVDRSLWPPDPMDAGCYRASGSKEKINCHLFLSGLPYCIWIYRYTRAALLNGVAVHGRFCLPPLFRQPIGWRCELQDERTRRLAYYPRPRKLFHGSASVNAWNKRADAGRWHSCFPDATARRRRSVCPAVPPPRSCRPPDRAPKYASLRRACRSPEQSLSTLTQPDGTTSARQLQLP
jgi:hypothetical protein